MRSRGTKRRNLGALNGRFFAVVGVMAALLGLFYLLAQYTFSQFGNVRVQIVEEGTLVPVDGVEVAFEGLTGTEPGRSQKPIRLKFLPEGSGSYRATAVMGTYALTATKDGYEPLEKPGVAIDAAEHKDLGRVVLRRKQPPAIPPVTPAK
jgi:hypothetical protein